MSAKLKKLMNEKLPKSVLDHISDHGVSNVKNKKFYVVYKNKKINFGHSSYDDYTTHKDDKRRDAFRARFGNSKFKNDPTSPLYYSYNLLW